MGMLAKKTSRMPAMWDSPFEELLNWTPFSGNIMVSNFPAVNVKESENEYSIEVAAPGLKKEDFEVNVDEDMVNISYEHKEESSQEEENVSHREYSFSSFQRTYRLPSDVDAEKVKASFDNGILNICLPKKGEVPSKNAKKIDIG